jgi:hypothetical protein
MDYDSSQLWRWNWSEACWPISTLKCRRSPFLVRRFNLPKFLSGAALGGRCGSRRVKLVITGFDRIAKMVDSPRPHRCADWGNGLKLLAIHASTARIAYVIGT